MLAHKLASFEVAPTKDRNNKLIVATIHKRGIKRGEQSKVNAEPARDPRETSETVREREREGGKKTRQLSLPDL